MPCSHGEFRYDRQPVGWLQGTAPDLVAYVGTASRALAPGLRLGGAVVPHDLVEPVVHAKLHADHGTDALGQLTLAEVFAAGPGAGGPRRALAPRPGRVPGLVVGFSRVSERGFPPALAVLRQLLAEALR